MTWTTEVIAAATGCPAAAVANNWPLLLRELEARGIASREVCAAAIATVAIETASTFEPVREAFWLSEAWRAANLRYYPYYGRGYIQLTWESNYRAYLGDAAVANPDMALEPGPAAVVLATYFVERGVAAAAQQRDWAEVRRRVQGAYAGLDRLIAIAERLLATEDEEMADPVPQDYRDKFGQDVTWPGIVANLEGIISLLLTDRVDAVSQDKLARIKAIVEE